MTRRNFHIIKKITYNCNNSTNMPYYVDLKKFHEYSVSDKISPSHQNIDETLITQNPEKSKLDGSSQGPSGFYAKYNRVENCERLKRRNHRLSLSGVH